MARRREAEPVIAKAVATTAVMSFTMCLGHKSYSGGNLTVAVSAAMTGADDTTQHLIVGSGNWPATPNAIWSSRRARGDRQGDRPMR